MALSNRFNRPLRPLHPTADELSHREVAEAESRAARDAYQELGRLYIADERFQEGETVLHEGLRLSPSSWEFHYLLGAAYFGMGKYKEAEQAYLKAASFNPAMPVNFRLRLANLYLKTRENEKAYAQLQAYLREAPDGPAAESVRKTVKRLESTNRVEPSADGSIDILDPTR